MKPLTSFPSKSTLQGVLGSLIVVSLAGCMTPSPAPEGPIDPALSDFDQPGRRMPSIKTLATMANILAIQGRDSECQAVLEQLVHDHPAYVPAYNDLAELYMRRSMVSSAVEALAAGLEYGPDDPILNNNLGMCHILQGEYELAFESFRRAAGDKPMDARTRSNMALALGMLERDEEAFALFDQVMSKKNAEANMDVIRRARARARSENPEAFEAREGEALAATQATEAPARPTPQPAAPEQNDRIAAAEAEPLLFVEEETAAIPAKAQPAARTTAEPELAQAEPVAAASEPAPELPQATDLEAAAETEAPAPRAMEAAETTALVHAEDPELSEAEARAMEQLNAIKRFEAARSTHYRGPQEASQKEQPAAEAAPAAEEATEQAPAESTPEPEAPAAEEDAEEANEEPTQSQQISMNSDYWRGLDASQLVTVGAIRYESTPDVEVRLTGSSRVKVRLSDAAKNTVWVFSPATDFRLHPGAIVEFNAAGNCIAEFGGVENFTKSQVAMAR